MNLRISRGGQVSIPAAVRRRWATDRLVIEDLGDRIILRPIPRDPIAAARGAFPAPGHSAAKDKQRLRREEQAAERRTLPR